MAMRHHSSRTRPPAHCSILESDSCLLVGTMIESYDFIFSASGSCTFPSLSCWQRYHCVISVTCPPSRWLSCAPLRRFVLAPLAILSPQIRLSVTLTSWRRHALIGSLPHCYWPAGCSGAGYLVGHSRFARLALEANTAVRRLCRGTRPRRKRGFYTSFYPNHSTLGCSFPTSNPGYRSPWMSKEAFSPMGLAHTVLISIVLVASRLHPLEDEGIPNSRLHQERE